MLKSGLMGMECYHSNFTKEEMAYYLEIANRYNLLVSGGSDFHGNPERKNQMGVCINHDEFISKELLSTWKKDKLNIKKLVK